MLNPGDYAIVSGYGVCRISSVGHPSLPAADPARNYYTLDSVHDNGTVHIPCDTSEEQMRPVISKEKALSLLSGIPSMKIKRNRDKTRLIRYNNAINDGRPEALLPVIMEIYQGNIEEIKKGKPIRNYTEATIFRKAEEMLNEELSIAMGCRPDDVTGIIRNVVETARKAE